MLGKLKKKILKKKVDENEVEVESRQGQTMREKIESYTEAITFAEAGLQEEAQEIMRAELAEIAKVLVVGHEDTFSKPLVDYAVGFAERMGYEIVALNISPGRTMAFWRFWNAAASKLQQNGISSSHFESRFSGTGASRSETPASAAVGGSFNLPLPRET